MSIQPRHQADAEKVATFEGEYPKEFGPPPLDYLVLDAGKKAAEAKDPEYTIHLDAGAFRIVWELLEAEGKYRFPTRNVMSSTQALLRGVEAFRRAYQHHGEQVAEASERVGKAGVRRIPKKP